MMDQRASLTFLFYSRSRLKINSTNVFIPACLCTKLFVILGLVSGNMYQGDGLFQQVPFSSTWSTALKWTHHQPTNCKGPLVYNAWHTEIRWVLCSGTCQQEPQWQRGHTENANNIQQQKKKSINSSCGLGQHSQYSNPLWAEWSREWILVLERFSAPTQPHSQWGPGHSQGYSSHGMALTTHPHLLPRLKKE